MYHSPVLLKESVDGLHIQPSGVYVDVTFGGGGHTRAILSRLGPRGRLIAFDQDADAQANAQAIADKRLTMVRGNFRFLRNFLLYYKATPIDGLLADLGVSSHQFDTADRGFSFRFEADLDMRMNQQGGLTAIQVLATYTLDQLTAVLRHYGELDNAYKVARLIVEARGHQPLATTAQLEACLQGVLPKFDEHKYLAKLYQALRIEVNAEMRALEQMLQHAAKVIKPGGRLSVITYHSLEDRIVKNFLRSGNAQGHEVKDIYGNSHTQFDLVNKKVILPQEEEIATNPRARSAKLRVASKK